MKSILLFLAFVVALFVLAPMGTSHISGPLSLFSSLPSPVIGRTNLSRADSCVLSTVSPTVETTASPSAILQRLDARVSAAAAAASFVELEVTVVEAPATTSASSSSSEPPKSVSSSSSSSSSSGESDRGRRRDNRVRDSDVDRDRDRDRDRGRTYHKESGMDLFMLYLPFIILFLVIAIIIFLCYIFRDKLPVCIHCLEVRRSTSDPHPFACACAAPIAMPSFSLFLFLFPFRSILTGLL
jgi:hypothetical protein